MNKLTSTRRRALEWFFNDLEGGKNLIGYENNQNFLDTVKEITSSLDFSEFKNKMIESLYFQNISDKNQYSDFQKCLDLISDRLIESEKLTTPNYYFNWYEQKMVVDVDKGPIKSLTHKSNSVEMKLYELYGTICCEIINSKETKIYQIKNPVEIIILLNFIDNQYFMEQYAIIGNLMK